MPLSHHSHSGQFCRHAKNTLEEMVLAALSQGMKAFAFTEHMPRDNDQDLYPEEVEAGLTVANLAQQFDDYMREAQRLRTKYASDAFCIAVGFETEWIRPSSLELVNTLFEIHDVDFVVGSVHHVHTIPIDFNRAMFEQAKILSGGTDVHLFDDYFDAQYAMLQALKPTIVGHFDLIRLYSNDADQDMRNYESVWQKITRNLAFIAEYGGIMEINSSALRKGMLEPYPSASICREFSELGGEFTLSDDSHSVDQVGLNYGRTLKFLQELNVQKLVFVRSRTTKSSIPLHHPRIG